MILRHLVTEADMGAVNAAAPPPPSPLQLNSLYWPVSWWWYNPRVPPLLS
jgi:hypothetical protein